MKNHRKVVVFAATLAAFALPGVAQDSSGTTSAPVTGQSINQRKENQQDRIAQWRRQRTTDRR